MKPVEYIYKTRPAYFFLSLCLVFGTICGVIAYKMLTANATVSGASEKTGHIIIVVFAGIFLAFGLVCVWCVICLKILYITEHELVIVWPLVFFSKSTLISSIRDISEKDAKINLTRSAFYQNLLTIGQTATLKLQDGRKLTISSLEVSGYNELIKKLHTQMRKGK